MPKKRSRTKASGSTRMREQGYCRADIWLSPKERVFIYRAANRHGLSLSGYLRIIALLASCTTEERREVHLQLRGREYDIWARLGMGIPPGADWE